MEKRHYRGAWEEVGICKVSPGADGERTAGVLGLNCVYRIKHKPLDTHGD